MERPSTSVVSPAPEGSAERQEWIRLSAALLDHLTRPFAAPLAGTSLDELRAHYAAHRDGVQSLVQAGATLLVGTDASTGGTPAAHGISTHREMELLTEAGLSPLEVLRAATARTADGFLLSDRGVGSDQTTSK